MTAIIGVEAQGKVFIGGDSAIISGNYFLEQDSLPKVSRVNEELIIGVSGLSSVNHKIKLELPNLFKKRNHFIEELGIQAFLYRHICPKLIKYQKELPSESGYSLLLVGYRDELYSIGEGYRLVFRERKGIQTIGSGADIVLGAYLALDIPDISQRIQKALEITESYNASVANPFHVLST